MQRDEAERANIAKSKFLAAASHDLRQPLHALRLFTSALDERIRYPDVRRIVSNINDSVRALEGLFSALLDVSRLDAGVLQPVLRHFRLQELTGRLMKDYAPEAEVKGLRLACVPTEAVVYSDPALLERILRNYVSNAIRYTDVGEVTMLCIEDDRNVRIEVRDTGIGIAPEQQRDIFNEFYQLHNPERDRTKGLGLGLAIVDRVARLLDHPIAVRPLP
jgi:signal transduction histidine kinase